MLAILVALSTSLLVNCPAAFAQSIFATLSGNVTDPNGAVIPGANVNVQNTSTNVVRQLTTSGTGYFSVTDLQIGTYNVAVQAKGFMEWKATGIVLNSSDTKTLTIKLTIGAQSESVTVSASASEIAITETGEQSSTISSEQLQHLALVGRNAMEFLAILPGAGQITQGGTNQSNFDGQKIGINGATVNGSAGGMSGTSINGQSGTGLSINMDGQNVEDPGGPGSATPVNPNPDMISEVTVLTSNYGADNAKGPIVINSMTKSGGSTFHCGAHIYARNSALNSEQAFNKAIEVAPGSPYTPGQLKVPSHYYYPGFSVGGPIIIPGTEVNKARNKYFFHESYEAYRQLIDGGLLRDFVPTAAMVDNGDFSATTNWGSSQQSGRPSLSTTPVTNSFENGTAATSTSAAVPGSRPGCNITGGILSSKCISSAAQLWMKDSIPLPTTTTGAPDITGFNYVAPVQQSLNSWQNVAKLDFNLGENTKAYLTWSAQREHSVNPLGLWEGGGDWVLPAPSPILAAEKSDSLTANLLHIFTPTLTVEARFGFTQMDMPGQPLDPSKVLRKQMDFPLTGVFGNQNAPIATSWSNNIPNIGDIGRDYHPTFYAKKAVPSAGADLTKVYKTHTAKFGAFWDSVYNDQDAWSQYMGVFSFNQWNGASGNSYADMLMGSNFGYYEQAMPPSIKMFENSISFYATDKWKLTRRITLDYGLRFEHFGPGSPNGSIGDATWTPAQYSAGTENSGISWHGINSSISMAGQSITPILYSPRVGGAIDVFENGKTVVRGGWGQFRYENYVVTNQGAANTAIGSAAWGAPGTAKTWEQIDQFVNTGGANGTSSTCAANMSGGIDAGKNDCPPIIKWGGVTNFTNSSVTVVDATNHDMPYTTTYSGSIDQQLPGRFMLEVAYVGNHSYKTQNGVNVNSVPIGTLTNPANISLIAGTPQLTLCSGMDSTSSNVLSAQQQDGNCQQKFRAYGGNYQGISATESTGEAKYDSGQISLTRQAGWATGTLNYTLAKNFADSNAAGALKDYGLKEYMSVAGIDRGQTFNAVYTFAFPKMTNGTTFDHALLNGWELSGITQVMSGAQMTANSGSALSLSNAGSGSVLVGSPDVSVAPVLTCNPAKGLLKGQYANPSCFGLPLTAAQGIGNTRFPYLVGPMFWKSDLSATKNVKLSEHEDLNLRASAFNILNHDLLSFAPGDNNAKLNFSSTGVLSNATDTSHACPGPYCQAFGYPSVHYGYRVIELSAKYTF
jgi:hypothetical protein